MSIELCFLCALSLKQVVTAIEKMWTYQPKLSGQRLLIEMQCEDHDMCLKVIQYCNCGAILKQSTYFGFLGFKD